VAFKPNIDDARNSPAERVIELLLKQGAQVSYHDPYVPTFKFGGDIVLKEEKTLESVPLTSQVLADVDCCAIITGHCDIDYAWVVEASSLVVDTVNATRNVTPSQNKIIRLGALNHSLNI
jgi:UDP-N-acetyl-D-glucosamine dehydrogenase